MAVAVPEKTIQFATPLLSYNLPLTFGHQSLDQTYQTAQSSLANGAPFAQSWASTPLDRAVHVVARALDLNAVLVASLLP